MCRAYIAQEQQAVENARRDGGRAHTHSHRALCVCLGLFPTICVYYKYTHARSGAERPSAPEPKARPNNRENIKKKVNYNFFVYNKKCL